MIPMILINEVNEKVKAARITAAATSEVSQIVSKYE